LAILVSSVAFALAHGMRPDFGMRSFVGLMLLGVTAGVFALRPRGGIATAFAFHAGINAAFVVSLIRIATIVRE
jgi:membrane protease YdiL (CAAX protease family)